MAEVEGDAPENETPKDSLTPKQAMFCEEYLKDCNATQAAERAGYSKATARAQGSRLLTNGNVRARINELMVERGERVRLDADYVLYNLTAVVERCMQRAPVMVRQGKHFVHATDEAGNNIWKFDAQNANSALGLLGRHLKLFTEKHEHSGPDGKPIEHKHLNDLPDDQLEAKIAAMLAKNGGGGDPE
jgi:phage terminase small subunit